MKRKHFHLLSQDKKRASFKLVLPFGGAFVAGVSPAAAEVMRSLRRNAAPGAVAPSSLAPPAQAAPAFETFEDVKPKDGDYIYPLFRALSQTLIRGHWIDFSEPGVLEESVPLLEGQTVYKNHNFWDVEQWLGAVNRSVWDAAGEGAGGVPGINAELKIDWKVNPLVARGLLMTPPAIHSVSVTVESEFEYSHPELAEKGPWAFSDMLGEEVNGEVVRFIVKRVLSYWEISLVFKGADDLAEFGDVAEVARESFAARAAAGAGKPPAPTAHGTAKESETVKLNASLKAALGLAGHEGEDLPEDLVLPRVEELARRAADDRAAADRLAGAARAECLRVATLAEAGGDGQLPAPLAEIINSAGPDQLLSLTALYTEKAASKFTSTCQHCGVAAGAGARSSLETPPAEAGAGRQQSVNSADALH